MQVYVSRSCRIGCPAGGVGAVPGLVGPTSKDVEPQQALLDCVHMPQQPLLPAMPEDAVRSLQQRDGFAQYRLSARGGCRSPTKHE